MWPSATQLDVCLDPAEVVAKVQIALRTIADRVARIVLVVQHETPVTWYFEWS